MYHPLKNFNIKINLKSRYFCDEIIFEISTIYHFNVKITNLNTIKEDKIIRLSGVEPVSPVYMSSTITTLTTEIRGHLLQDFEAKNFKSVGIDFKTNFIFWIFRASVSIAK